MTYKQVVDSYPGDYSQWQGVLGLCGFALLVLFVICLCGFFVGDTISLITEKEGQKRKERRRIFVWQFGSVLLVISIVLVSFMLLKTRIAWENDMTSKTEVWERNVQAYVALQTPVNVSVRDITYGDGGVTALVLVDGVERRITFSSNIELREGIDVPFIEAVWVPDFGDGVRAHWESEVLVMPK